jgi:hypothetical protein
MAASPKTKRYIAKFDKPFCAYGLSGPFFRVIGLFEITEAGFAGLTPPSLRKHSLVSERFNRI